MKRPKHLRKHGLSRTPEYRAWQQMRLRCLDPKHAAYANYGGRGITVCDRWKDSPEAFLADVGHKPSPRHEIDRIDNDRGYEPGNCRWATRAENDRNRRSNRLVTHAGKTLALAEWSERTGIPTDTLKKRLDGGWTVEAALAMPARPKAPRGADTRHPCADCGSPCGRTSTWCKPCANRRNAQLSVSPAAREVA